MISRITTASTRAVFGWRQVSKNNYQFLCGPDVRGSFSLSLEPSILFEPAQCEFYRACAETNDRKYFFKCVFLDGLFRGSVLTEEAENQPLMLYQERLSKFPWGRRSRLIFCRDGTTWSWLQSGEKGSWIVRSGGNRVLELKSASPRLSGIVRVYSPSFLKSVDSQILMLFCVYLAIGPRRQST